MYATSFGFLILRTIEKGSLKLNVGVKFKIIKDINKIVSNLDNFKFY